MCWSLNVTHQASVGARAVFLLFYFGPRQARVRARAPARNDGCVRGQIYGKRQLLRLRCSYNSGRKARGGSQGKHCHWLCRGTFEGRPVHLTARPRGCMHGSNVIELCSIQRAATCNGQRLSNACVYCVPGLTLSSGGAKQQRRVLS